MFSKTGVHAIKAVVLLAGLPEGEYAGTSQIANKISAPQNYLGKLLQALSYEGIVSSQKGLNGGFRLAKKPDEISLMGVIDPIENVSRISGCILSRGECDSNAPCALHKKWGKIRETYIQFLENTKISDLVGKNMRFELQK